VPKNIARIPLPEQSEISEEIKTILEKYPPINVYAILAHAPSCCGPWIDLIKGIYATGIDVRLREIAICRIGYLTGSDYELHQHHFIALKNGVTEEEIQIITSEGPVSSLDIDGNFICQVVDELEKTAKITDETFLRLREMFSVSDMVAFGVMLATYCAVGRLANFCRLEIEPSNPLQGFVGFATK
jgi:alkylhydroperoxidase/carboxymuconolactone decarboxylase family protein YurZ